MTVVSYEPGSSYTTQTSNWHFFYAEVVARFHPKDDPAAIELEVSSCLWPQRGTQGR